MEADRLKIITENGIPRKVVIIGIGRAARDEIGNIASELVYRNGMYVPSTFFLGSMVESVAESCCTSSIPSNSSICFEFVICNREKSTVEV